MSHIFAEGYLKLAKRRKQNKREEKEGRKRENQRGTLT
jgi:hypothetical protein